MIVWRRQSLAFSGANHLSGPTLSNPTFPSTLIYM